jgi:hypothetical protein
VTRDTGRRHLLLTASALALCLAAPACEKQLPPPWTEMHFSLGSAAQQSPKA